MEKRCPARNRNIAEALLFAAGEPVSRKDLAKVLGVSEQEAESIVLDLAQEYKMQDKGMQVIRLEDRFQMTTNPLYYPNIELLYRQQAQIRLTDTQLETLAIIAYRQPVTRQEINDIRGVSSDAVVTRLQEMGLVEEAGRLKAPGRPLLLKTSDAFLKAFKLSSVREMPHLPEPSQETLDNLELPRMPEDSSEKTSSETKSPEEKVPGEARD
ncbi:MAG: SMC-Scp complex subunit ScpB [Lachnospiraceae bacterium]|nr:SMC-Scp complex subunit ScpB [Lachnospiraceae bacterium]